MSPYQSHQRSTILHMIACICSKWETMNQVSLPLEPCYFTTELFTELLKILEYLQITKSLKMTFFLDRSFGIGLK